MCHFSTTWASYGNSCNRDAASHLCASLCSEIVVVGQEDPTSIKKNIKKICLVFGQIKLLHLLLLWYCSVSTVNLACMFSPHPHDQSKLPLMDAKRNLKGSKPFPSLFFLTTRRIVLASAQLMLNSRSRLFFLITGNSVKIQ